MPINLTTPFTLSNGTRLVISRPVVDEDAQTISFTISLRTAPGGTPPDSTVSDKRLQIRSGGGDQVSRNASPVAGGRHDDLLIFTPNGVVTANAFTNAYTALKTNRATFEAHLLSAGYVHSTLTGT